MANYAKFSRKTQKTVFTNFPILFGIQPKSGVQKPLGGMVFVWKVNKKLLDMDPRDPKGPKKAKIGEASKLSR